MNCVIGRIKKGKKIIQSRTGKYQSLLSPVESEREKKPAIILIPQVNSSSMMNIKAERQKSQSQLDINPY